MSEFLNLLNYSFISFYSVSSKSRFNQTIRIMNSGGKNAIFEVYSELIYQFINKNLTSLQICREPYITIPTVIYTKKDFYFLQALNEKIEELKGTGLIEYWFSMQFVKEFGRDDDSPKILTLNHLSGCFLILAGGCFISFIAFILELIIFKLKKRSNKARVR